MRDAARLRADVGGWVDTPHRDTGRCRDLGTAAPRGDTVRMVIPGGLRYFGHRIAQPPLPPDPRTSLLTRPSQAPGGGWRWGGAVPSPTPASPPLLQPPAVEPRPAHARLLARKPLEGPATWGSERGVETKGTAGRVCAGAHGSAGTAVASPVLGRYGAGWPGRLLPPALAWRARAAGCFSGGV